MKTWTARVEGQQTWRISIVIHNAAAYIHEWIAISHQLQNIHSNNLYRYLLYIHKDTAVHLRSSEKLKWSTLWPTNSFVQDALIWKATPDIRSTSVIFFIFFLRWNKMGTAIFSTREPLIKQDRVRHSFRYCRPNLSVAFHIRSMVTHSTTQIIHRERPQAMSSHFNATLWHRRSERKHRALCFKADVTRTAYE